MNTVAELKKITVTIGAQTYSLDIEAHKVDLVHRAVNYIESKKQTFAKAHQLVGDERIVAMVLLEMTMLYLHQEQLHEEKTELVNQSIHAMNTKIAHLLSDIPD